jgi:hypothetical protein
MEKRHYIRLPLLGLKVVKMLMDMGGDEHAQNAEKVTLQQFTVNYRREAVVSFLTEEREKQPTFKIHRNNHR